MIPGRFGLSEADEIREIFAGDSEGGGTQPAFLIEKCRLKLNPLWDDGAPVKWLVLSRRVPGPPLLKNQAPEAGQDRQ